MKTAVSSQFKRMLTHLGALSSKTTIHALNAMLNYLEVGRWMREHGFVPAPRCARREELFDRIAAEVAGKDVLYLEFGVHRGASIACWSGLLKGPNDHLHGFDSFEGLPEDWNAMVGKGHFSTDGQAPVIDDPRVRFFKGWFEDTLPRYTPPEHNQLIINIDADLYSSTAFVLGHLKDRMPVGTFVYFDEFCDRLQELKAFDEFLAATGMQFQLVGATRTLAHVAFRRTS